MKYKFISLCFALFLLISLNSTAQSIDHKETKFNYISRPLKPLNKDIKFYNSVVVPTYLEANKKLMDAYNEDLRKSEEDYQNDLRIANEDYDKAMQQYNKDLDVYNSKSSAKKIIDKQLNNEGKPVMPNKRTPSKRNVEKPTVQKDRNFTTLANTYLKLYGYKPGADNAVKITATLNGFEVMGPTLKTEESSEYRGGQTYKTVKYKYEIQYRHPMGVKVESSADGVLLEDFPVKMSNFIIYNTELFPSSYELDKFWNQSKNSLLSSLEDKILETNLLSLNDLVNSNFGFPSITRTANVYTVKDKKGTYADYETANTAYEEGYKMLGENSTKTNAVAKLNEAITIWETAMKESDPTNRKARIDEGVTTATLFNLVEACIWADDFQKAEAYWKKLHKMDLSKKETKKAEELESFMKDQKARYDANK